MAKKINRGGAMVSPAARHRSTSLQRKQGATQPPRKYDIHDVVVHNGQEWKIVGYEWGEDHRNFRREVWLYYLAQGEQGPSDERLVEESKLEPRQHQAT